MIVSRDEEEIQDLNYLTKFITSELNEGVDKEEALDFWNVFEPNKIGLIRKLSPTTPEAKLVRPTTYTQTNKVQSRPFHCRSDSNSNPDHDDHRYRRR
ncbi:unnamed protein product [Sphenostylis stenocarpa]|uniref:Uncharacterized protein n=1 Tax=Sphenostylis stenocarpa TaxID=92480 RepID=A0AA86RWA9_9FABA|nr:unnamed protein product [Sphenostylis stenocarpa]